MTGREMKDQRFDPKHDGMYQANESGELCLT